MRTSGHECSFCAVVHREDPDAREVYRDEHVVAFLPAEPATLGHVLIVPHQHIPDIWSLDTRTATQIGRATIALADVVRRALAPEGLNVIQSNGAAAGQTVMHLHVHLVPRWSGDVIGSIWPPKTHYSDAEIDDIWKRLRV